MRRLLLLLALCFSAPAAAADLKIATWNLEWLTERPAGDPALPANVVPRAGTDIGILRGYAERLAADVVAVQEVDGTTVLARVFSPDRYRLHLTNDAVVQRVGFAVRRDLAFTANPDLVGLDLYPDAKHRLRSGADITLDLPGGKLRLLAVHIKSGCRQDRLASSDRRECVTLRGQLPVLQGWIAQRRAEGVPFVLLGDLNRWMDGNDAFLAGLSETGPLARPTAGQTSPCWGGGGFIDHILAGGAARGWLVEDSLRVMVFKETGIAWEERLSDHCPVSARFRLPD
jgi:endonuclease/exonuclease/phosphatase family metal-dependent hydrolase